MKSFADFRIDVPHSAAGEIDVVCPECSPTRKKKHARCLSVNATEGTWICHHCGWSGSLKQGADRSAELHWRKPAYRRPEPIAIPEAHDTALVQWMAARGISPAVIRRNQISLQPVYMPQVEDRVKAICFPYFRDGALINAKYRDREKNFRMIAGAERVLYGLDDIDVRRVVIVEGEVDKLSIEMAGITSCVSVPDGAPSINAKNYESKFTFLDDERIGAVKEWIIAVDNDEPGLRLENELSRRFGVELCKRVAWPADCKDANDVLMKHGASKLRECIDTAQEFPIRGVIYASQLKREIELLYLKGDRQGASFLPGLDKHYTVREGEVTLITGTPGSGKSNVMDAGLVNLARDYHWIVPIFSPENQPIERHLSRLMEKFIREPFRAGPTPRMSPERRDEAVEWVDFYFPMISPEDESDWTLDRIFGIAKSLLRRHGIKGIVIDPWNELEHHRPSHLSESEYVGLSLRKVRAFARRTGLHVWIVAHPAKMYRNKDGNYPMPTLYDVSGSANFYNKIDNGIVVYRDKKDPAAPVEVHVQKIRFRETGEIGTVNYRYNRVLADYEPMAGPVRDRWSAPVVEEE